MTRSMIRNILVGSAVALAAAQQQMDGSSNALANLDLTTAEAVPTSCTAEQMTAIYNDCIAQCESTMTADVVSCDDVNTRYLLVKCAAQTDQCDATAAGASSGVVRQAQVARLQEVCSNGQTTFQMGDVKLLFASAADVAASLAAQTQVDQLAMQANGNDSMDNVPLDAMGMPTTSSARSSGGLYGSGPNMGSMMPPTDNLGAMVPPLDVMPMMPQDAAGMYGGSMIPDVTSDWDDVIDVNVTVSEMNSTGPIKPHRTYHRAGMEGGFWPNKQHQDNWHGNGVGVDSDVPTGTDNTVSTGNGNGVGIGNGKGVGTGNGKGVGMGNGNGIGVGSWRGREHENWAGHSIGQGLGSPRSGSPGVGHGSAAPAVGHGAGSPGAGQATGAGTPGAGHAVNDYTWGEGSGKGQGQGQGKGQGKSQGNGNGKGHGSGKATEKGSGSGSGYTGVSGPAGTHGGVSGSMGVNATKTYNGTTPFKSNMTKRTGNSVARALPAVSALLAVGLAAFFAL